MELNISKSNFRLLTSRRYKPCLHGDHLCSSLQEVMSVEEESTSCYCLMDSSSCHLLLDQPGSYALVGEPLTQAAVKRLKLAVFGSMEAGSMNYSLRVYCVDDTPHTFQVGKDAGFSVSFIQQWLTHVYFQQLCVSKFSTFIHKKLDFICLFWKWLLIETSFFSRIYMYVGI